MKTFETEKNNIPKGATHYANETDTDCFAWYREDTKEIMVGGYVVNEWEDTGKDENLTDLKPIPKPEVVDWNGEGLPPVDVECEWIGGGLSHGDWGAVIVRAYNDDYAWIEKLHDKSMYTVRNPAHFRKPETPEQKAERELYEAIEEGYNLAPEGLDIPINQYVAKLLYQQGYRKQ